MNETLNLAIKGMKCEKCPPRIKNAFASVDGIKACEVDLDLGCASITYDCDVVATEAIMDVFKDLPFTAEVIS